MNNSKNQYTQMSFKRTAKGYYSSFFAMLLIASVFTVGCKKTEVVTEPEEVIVPVAFNTIHRVENLPASTDNNSATAAPVIYFSLETKELKEAKDAKTTRWDIAFGGLFNSFLSGNNGSASTNFGYGSAGKGGVLILEKAFNEVTDIPADALFKTGKNIIGTDDAGDYGSGTGWYLYDYTGLKMGTGMYEKQHVAYSLAEGLTLLNGTEISPRTIVVKTANGNYAKVKIISCYKDAFQISDWSRDIPHMYFTFEYVLAAAGSTKFEIK
ncbi:HmuY family protein [Pedobacter sp. MW01-1-1]|uniref:HmuY family protein n=1 Tax=Pedobacter sp. MW01-1-1 TaxID=3383027 RepID=UPI003FEE8EB0